MTPAPRGLVYVSDARPGIRRVRRGGGNGKPARFDYFARSGRRITDPAVIGRIAALAIPPAYEDVWICSNPRGHLQATGRDARGRKQYRYHPQWRVARDSDKHSRMLQFGTALARLRPAVRSDLKLPGLPKEKVLALVVRLLDSTQVRIGNAEYARDNHSYGLSTLRDRHLRFARGKALLRFPGKGGAEHDVLVSDPRIVRLIRRCQSIPGQQLFQYVDADGTRHRIDSGQVNAYLQERMGGQFSAKDFRTWHATLHAIELLHGMALPERGGERALKRCVNEVIREVATGLRNTPAVCRKSYINPAVFVAWQSGELRRLAARRGSTRPAALALALLKRARGGNAPATQARAARRLAPARVSEARPSP
jgi:DNA topoisomerase-1